MFNVNVFAPLMKQRVSLAPFAGYDGYGTASYGADVVYDCAVIGEIKRVITQDGQEVPSRQTVYLRSDVMVRPEDRGTRSTGDVGSTESYAINPLILSVGLFPFGSNAGITVVYLK